MKKKILLLILLLMISSITVYALSYDLKLDFSKLSIDENSKDKVVLSNFNQMYKLDYVISDENEKLKAEIETLTKKTTYLLFGDFNNINESSENYYKRKKDWYELRYNPEIPKDNNNSLGLNTDSQEYKDDIMSGLAIAQVFNQASELGLIYNTYGDIRVTINDDLIISSITLPNVKLKEQSVENPQKYDYIETNFVMYYFYKKLNDEWKLYYAYGENIDDIKTYFNEIESVESKTMSIAPSYESQLNTIYNFDKLNKMSQKEFNNIYNANANKIVVLNSYYNNYAVASSNGFFINDGLIITTWSFLEKSLINAQYITASNYESSYEIEGIVTVDPQMDIAIIKVKNTKNNAVTLGDYKTAREEDPVVTIIAKIGNSSLMQKGIIIANKEYIQTSIPLSINDEGSPLLNQNGEVIGMNTSKSSNASISIAINSDILKEIQNKFSQMSYDQIETISFKELKEKYYYVKRNDENIINNIPKSKWKIYSKIGDLEEAIKLKLVKANYKDGIISLRYKNDISQFISGMQLATNYKENLIKDGYEEVLSSDNKAIYKNKKYQIIIMEEFDYLIIVMVKL